MGQVDKSAFDIKLARGVLREVTLEEVLRVRGGHDIELKSDEMCATTGNVFVVLVPVQWLLQPWQEAA